MDFTAERELLDGNIGAGAEKALSEASYGLSQYGSELADYSSELNETAAHATQTSEPSFGLALSLLAFGGAVALAYIKTQEDPQVQYTEEDYE